ncbi:FHA domain-containing protein [Actinomadura sp. NPDC048021]|uniref:FHA domain-containing protein n=1 Tax=Actinomadura sp. NPDC048021 TaxID=3155385 RepID=UPI0033FCECEE
MTTAPSRGTTACWTSNAPDIRVRDFGRRNGTYVNGVKIGQREAGQAPEDADHRHFPEHDLRTGDEIALGPTVLRVHIDAPRACFEVG